MLPRFAPSLQLCVQLALSRQQSMCLATLPGTHNSGITLADGYGNLDPQFQDYFKWIKWIVNLSSVSRVLLAWSSFEVTLRAYLYDSECTVNLPESLSRATTTLSPPHLP